MGMQVNGQGHRWHGRVDVCTLVSHYGFTRELFFPHSSVIKHWDTLVLLFMSLLLQLVVFIYQCSHQLLYPFTV
jgi:hypothetical protein